MARTMRDHVLLNARTSKGTEYREQFYTCPFGDLR